MQIWPWKKRSRIWQPPQEAFAAAEAPQPPKAATKASARRYGPAYAAAIGALHGRASVPPRANAVVRAWHRADRARRDVSAADASLASSEAALASAPHGSLIDVVIHLVACTIGLSAEFVMNYVALPFLYDIEPASFEGVALSAAPTAAMLILDVIIERLIEGPFRRRASLGKAHRAGAYAVMGVFKVLAVALLVYTVALVAGARELAHLETTEGGVASALALHQTSVAIAFLVCLTCGWFTTLAIADLKAWHHRRGLMLRLDRDRRAVASAAATAADAAGVLAAAQLAARDSTADAKDIAQAVRSGLLMELVHQPAPPDDARKDDRRGPSLRDLVREAVRVQARRRLAGDA